MATLLTNKMGITIDYNDFFGEKYIMLSFNLFGLNGVCETRKEFSERIPGKLTELFPFSDNSREVVSVTNSYPSGT